MFRNQDTALEIERLAKIFLPDEHSVRVGDRCKDVIQNHLIELGFVLVHAPILTPLRAVINLHFCARKATTLKIFIPNNPQSLISPSHIVSALGEYHFYDNSAFT